MARPSKGGQQVNVRLWEDDLARVDQLVEVLRASMPGATRSDAIRVALVKGLEVELGPQKGKAKR